MRRVYRDRAAWLGDPDFTEIPMDRLLSAEYARALRAEIDMAQATPSTELPVPVAGGEGRQTTHFSVVDGQGNRVAATLSINYPFGATTVPPGTGVLLNNEMDDFATALGRKRLRPAGHRAQPHRAGQAPALQHDARLSGG